MTQRYPTNTNARLALVPGLLAGILLLTGVALIGTDWFIMFRYAISILAVIVAVFAIQAKQWWWVIGLAPIAILWNPIFPIDLDILPWQFAHILAAAIFIAAGLRIRVAVAEDRKPGGR
jgi:hypothetical protein